MSVPNAVIKSVKTSINLQGEPFPMSVLLELILLERILERILEFIHLQRCVLEVSRTR